MVKASDTPVLCCHPHASVCFALGCAHVGPTGSSSRAPQAILTRLLLTLQKSPRRAVGQWSWSVGRVTAVCPWPLDLEEDLDMWKILGSDGQCLRSLRGVLQGLQGLDVAGEKSEISLFFFFSCNRNFKCQIKGFFTLKVLWFCQEMAWCWRVWVDFPDHGVPFQQAASRLLVQESFLHLHCKIFVLLHCSGSLCFFKGL